MSTAEPRVLVALAQMLLQTGTSLGLQRRELLAEAGLEEIDLVDRDAYIPLARQLAIGHAIAQRLPNTNIGLEALTFARSSTLGTLGYVVSHCATLTTALRAFMRYQGLLSRAVQWSLEGTTIRIDASPPMQRLAFPLETQIGIWVQIGRELTGVNWVPQRVRLRHHPRGPVEPFTTFFGRPVEFGAPANELELSHAQLELPILGARPELQPSLARLVQSSIDEKVDPQCYEDKVRALLLEKLPQGLTSREEAARALGVSTRTLTRRLGEEDCSFRDLLAAVRQQLACAWLRDPDLSLHEIAFLLGYSEPGTFHRSFRRWTGQTPSDWRQRGV